MKNLIGGFFLAILSVMLFSCNSKNVTTEEQEGIQIDPELKELGELNVKLSDYDDMGIPHNGIVPVKRKGKWGLVNRNSLDILDCKYDDITYGDVEDVWIVKKNDSIGIVNHNGDFINKLNDSFSSYTCLGNGVLHAIWGRGNNSENYIIPIEYTGTALMRSIKTATPFVDGVSMMEWWMNYKLYTYDGDSLKSVTPWFSDFTGKCGEGLYCVKDYDLEKYGYIDSKGEVVIPFKFDNPCGAFSDGMAIYTDSTELMGYIDRNGDTIIPAQYHLVCPFSDGLAFVGNDEATGFIDKTGRMVIDTEGKYGIDENGFEKGFCVVMGMNDLMGIIDKKGDIVVPIDYVINPLSDDVYIAQSSGDNSKYGAFSFEGKQIIPFEFDEISDFHDGLALATIGDVKLLINKEGKTGIINMEEAMTIIMGKKEQKKQDRQKEIEEDIKKQLVKMTNEDFGRKVLDSPGDICDLTKEPDGTYKANFTVYGEYEHITYDVLKIKVDEDGIVKGYRRKLLWITPTDKKPDGTSDPEEIIRRATGIVGPIN